MIKDNLRKLELEIFSEQKIIFGLHFFIKNFNFAAAQEQIEKKACFKKHKSRNGGIGRRARFRGVCP